MSEHGVGFVGKIGVECMCGWTRSFESGGWVALNKHLAEAEAEDAARATDVLREAVTFVRDWAVDAQGTLDGPPFDPMLYGFDQIAQHCERALAATPASGTPASGETDPLCDDCGDPRDTAMHNYYDAAWSHPFRADHAAQRHDEGEGAR